MHIEKCPSCEKGKLKVVSSIEEPRVIKKILEHIGLDASIPRLAIYFQEKLYGIRPFHLINSHLSKSPWLSFEHKNLYGNIEDSQSFYGQVLLYLHNIDRNISKDVISNLIFSGKPWMTALNDYLKEKWPNFEESFIDFQIAKYIKKRDDYVLNSDDDFIYRYIILENIYHHIETNYQAIDVMLPLSFSLQFPISKLAGSTR